MAKEYIEREDALMGVMRAGCMANTVQVLKDIPAADVVEVVRCRHCKRSIEQFRVEDINGIACCNPNPILHCKYWDTEVSPSYFCGSGERRDSE